MWYDVNDIPRQYFGLAYHYRMDWVGETYPWLVLMMSEMDVMLITVPD
jgi:hypothetical protein